jgi:hypothetical protein
MNADMDNENQRDKARASVITINAGRGFVIEGGPRNERLVVTAAHCLPWLPPCNSGLDLEEQTYRALLAPLGSQPTVWAACLFADPVADVAVLGSPDDQELPNEAEAYNTLVESVTPIDIAEAPSWENEAWMLSLDGNWFQCRCHWSSVTTCQHLRLV